MASSKFQSNLMDLQANMLNFAYMLTSNRDDAYDLLQDTTLKALDNEDKYAENTRAGFSQSCATSSSTTTVVA